MRTKEKKKKGTSARSFGASTRENHDSSGFYKSRMYEGLSMPENVDFLENPVEETNLNKIFCKSSEDMSELPDNSVHLMVTSPPYNAGKEYDSNLSLEEYREFLSSVWRECRRVLIPGGRACINIANLGRKPYIPLHSFVIEDMVKLGFLMRGEIIWNKSSGGGTSTAWGSWLSAKNPTLRDVHEYILVFSKDSYSREKSDRESTITKEEFLEFTKSVWNFNPQSAKQAGHPAPFPVELPYRLIQLYTYSGELIVDPFMGSGQTAIAALKCRRKYIGYDINPEYIENAEIRIKEFITKSDGKI
ncbi:MAG: site-specific DNA-methyltransferase [Firmicutes bacterium]|nr:site-specific DNA-methyltransferase [Bacillota bacterium]